MRRLTIVTALAEMMLAAPSAWASGTLTFETGNEHAFPCKKGKVKK
jgi:hypothetical protein